MHRNARFKGFSLTEMIVTVAIISILSVVLFPAVSRVQDNARRAECVSNMRQLSTASLQFAQDYGGRIPFTAWSADPNLHERWMHQVAPYVNSGPDIYVASAVFRCPNGAAFKRFGRSPTYLGWDYIDYTPVGLYAPTSSEVIQPVRLQVVPNPSKVAMLVEGNNAGHAALWPGWTWNNVMTTRPAGTLPPVSRHSEGMNIAYMDGHVELVRSPTWNDLGMFEE